MKWTLKELAGILVACALVAIAAFIHFDFTPRPPQILTITPGPLNTTRAEVAQALANQANATGIDLKVVATKDAREKIALLDQGKISFALVSGVLHLEKFANVNEVCPLYDEALHLLVKQELAAAVETSFSNLRGHSIMVGNYGSAAAMLAESVLDYARLNLDAKGAAKAYRPIYQDPGSLAGSLKTIDRRTLPDAIFDFSTIPSKIADDFIIDAGYRLVSIPFADAFRLAEMYIIGENPDQNASPAGGDLAINRRFTTDVLIPPFTYSTNPPVPARPTHTIGAPLLLLANNQVSADSVSAILGVVFETNFARIMQPIISSDMLDLPPRVKIHTGTLDYRTRNQPLLGKDDIDELSSTLSAVGALAGGIVFFWQVLKKHRDNARQTLFGSYMSQLADIERKIIEVELSNCIAPDSLFNIQQALLTLKAEALRDYTEGRLGDHMALRDVLLPLNMARDNVGNLLLHVRDNLEDKAQSEGRTSQEMWDEAMKEGENFVM